MVIRRRDQNTYDVDFFNNCILTTVTRNPDKVSAWISEVEFVHRRRLDRLVVGLDVEWRPSNGRRYRSPVATLQLCVGRRCLIYQILHSHFVPQALTDFLRCDDYTFVGVGIESDLRKLQDDYGVGGETRWVDLAEAAAEEYRVEWLSRTGLKRLARYVLDAEMEKPRHVTMSEWDSFWLTTEQVEYACVDAFVSFEIGRTLEAYDY